MGVSKVVLETRNGDETKVYTSSDYYPWLDISENHIGDVNKKVSIACKIRAIRSEGIYVDILGISSDLIEEYVGSVICHKCATVMKINRTVCGSAAIYREECACRTSERIHAY